MGSVNILRFPRYRKTFGIYLFFFVTAPCLVTDRQTWTMLMLANFKFPFGLCWYHLITLPVSVFQM